ncbi:DUF1275 domain-containing protein [Streptomyces sp. AC550_RSS872]|uniref:DUF1275 domain-containing protein n=1 Tax=Streptomyces sp. AC550_RSS872 TaxID=2823689 RepID=UPI001C2515A0|nr:DUF1275 domain-containing protein [Streptomyces sp. AC550_RSS872]
MSGRGDSEISETRKEQSEKPEHNHAEELVDAEEPDDPEGPADDVEDPADGEEDLDEPAQVARRARWTAAVTGALLALAGLAASTLRATGSAPVLVPAAYALGAAVCALAAFLGSRGRTRRALWLLVTGVMVMALGDQFD